MSDGNELDEVQRKAAAFARQPSVWAATTPAHPEPRMRSRRIVAAGRASTGVLALCLIPPALLTMVFGDPRHVVPSKEVLTGFFGSQRSQNATQVAVAAVAVGLWLLWILTIILLVGSLLTVILGWRLPRWRLPAPLHRLLFGLAGTAVIAFVTTPHAGASTGQPSAAGPATPGADQPGASALRQGGTVTVLVGETQFEYEVKRGDTLSKIARRWLGDADRWPEICRLNRHQHQPGGAELTDCDLIYPGWKMRLPHDARPPAGTATKPPKASRPPKKNLPSPSTPESNRPGSTNPPTETPGPEPSAASPATTESPSATVTDEHGVRLSSGNWLPWTLVTAIAAAATMVWRQRRRRYTGEPDTATPTQLPPTVAEVDRVANRHPEMTTSSGDQAPTPSGPADLVPWPAGGASLVGDGAPAAARAALVAVLASGDPDHPAARGEVITDVATLSTLLGPDAPAPSPWPRMHVTQNLDDALAMIEAQLLHRSRILDEHDLTSLEQLRQAAPDEEALPPVILIAQTPATGSRMRTRAALTLGQALNVSAVLLGSWDHGVTVEVAADGNSQVVSGGEIDALPPRLPVLEPAAALEILDVLREAHTGEPPAATQTTSATTPPLDPRADEAAPEETPVTPTATAASGRARLRVLGPPRIEGITGEGRPLRAKALELAVLLAVHPAGMATRDIGEYLEPDARISQADQRVHTNASNLRHVLGRAGAAEPKNSYVIKTAGRYRLDPTTVDVDIWTLRDLVRSAHIAAEPNRREMLTTACELYTAPLAEGRDYDWIGPHREAVRRWGTDAHLMLAEDLMEHDPQAASDLLDKAIALDIYNEMLYTKAMRARYALGDADGIRTLLRGLTKSLADLDAEPREETFTLSENLREDLVDS
ncbi:BTAD domain-containing putative transcriptional regulator [Actinoplanes sp. NPDC020271]|uniref:BTAD domain-containing putative transcriptional regulator n=1 Tax=Actinoplanes sp. NPDC020271 TaxID=3363896 RepID=UPI0037B01A82